MHLLFEYFSLKPKAFCVFRRRFAPQHDTDLCRGAARSLEKRKGNAKKKQEKRKRRRKKVCEQNYEEKNCGTIIRKKFGEPQASRKKFGFFIGKIKFFGFLSEDFLGGGKCFKRFPRGGKFLKKIS